MISSREQRGCCAPNLLYESWEKQQKNTYDVNKNPRGIVNLGTAENKLTFDLIQPKLSSCDLGIVSESLTHYCNFTGTDDFRLKLCKFFTHFMKPVVSISPNDVYVVNGCGVAIETLGMICCNEGEAMLIPAPYYKAFDGDLGQRFLTKSYPVHLSMSNGFTLEVAQLQNAYDEAKKIGIIIKGVLVSNPINPLGVSYTRDQIKSYLEFCLRNNLHFVCDEIYTLSVYDKNEIFTSLLSMDNIDKYLHLIHVVWGFSKDFGLSGFRCGVIITFNKQVQMSLASQAYFVTVPTITQFILSTVINDLNWVESFMTTNHKRLLQSRDIVVNELESADISYLLPTCGLFLCFNVSKYLIKNTRKAELALFEEFMRRGVYIVPGSYLEFDEPGWFRIIISDEIDRLLVGVRRIIETLNCVER